MSSVFLSSGKEVNKSYPILTTIKMRSSTLLEEGVNNFEILRARFEIMAEVFGLNFLILC
jgi:hypothetical protein